MKIHPTPKRRVDNLGMPFGVKANVRAPHRFMRMGALVWIVCPNHGWGGEHVEVIGLSRGGRKVRTWMDSRDLTNFRAGWLPDGQTHLRRGYKAYWESKEGAQAWAAAINEWWASGPVRPHAAGFGASTASE